MDKGKYKARYVRNIVVEVIKFSKSKVWFIAESGVTWIYPMDKFKRDFERIIGDKNR